jgi:hypothetical protein
MYLGIHVFGVFMYLGYSCIWVVHVFRVNARCNHQPINTHVCIDTKQAIEKQYSERKFQK